MMDMKLIQQKKHLKEWLIIQREDIQKLIASGKEKRFLNIKAKLNVDPNLVVPNHKKSIADGAIEPWAKTTTLYYAQTLSSLAKHYSFSLDEKWSQLSKTIKDIILYGSDDEEIKFSYDDGYEKYSHKKTFEGVINNLERRYFETDSDWKRE